MRFPGLSLMFRTIIQEYVQQYSFSFHFLLRRAYADNEAPTRLLQILLFLLLLSCSFIMPLVIPSYYPSTSWVVFLYFLFPPLVRIAILSVVYCSPSF